MPPESKNLRQVPTRASLWWIAGCAFLSLFWVFWPTFLTLANRWGNDSRYSHGYFVPLFSIYLLWSRRGRFVLEAPNWLGLPLLLLGLSLRFLGDFIFFEWLEAFALLPCLAGLALLIGGRSTLKWSWPAILFLTFMLPLPFQVESMLARPLQRIATLASTYALQTIGFVAIAEGNTIRMGTVRLGVVEASSGLSMMLIF